MKEKRVWNFN